jgi:hypothetical protein
MNGSGPETVRLSIDLNVIVVRQLQQACPNEADVAAYIEHTVLHRTEAWRRSLSRLEDAGWTGQEIEDVHRALDAEPFLEWCSSRDLAAMLRWSGLRQLSRRVSKDDAGAAFLVCVVTELREHNAACARAVQLMRQTRKRWWWERR